VFLRNVGGEIEWSVQSKYVFKDGALEAKNINIVSDVVHRHVLFFFHTRRFRNLAFLSSGERNGSRLRAQPSENHLPYNWRQERFRNVDFSLFSVFRKNTSSGN
jgi:hypothetical protein